MAEQADYRYDVFVSFADGDRGWVEGYLLPTLALPQGRVITSQRTSRSESFQPGAAIVNEFERAVTGSRYTLLVLSRAYLADQWSTFGEQLASYTAVAEQRDRLIPLLRERDCPLPLRIEFRVRLDCTDQNNWEPEIGRLRELLAQPEPKPERIPCPYPGMIPFSGKDAGSFYGREDEIRQMLQHFRNQRLLFVIGPSGCGKSSLVFAGLLPQLQSSRYFEEGFWLVKQMRPGPRPVQALGRLLDGDPSKLLTSNPPAQRLLLVVDQFEELFSQAEQSEQSGFINALQALRTMENCALLITLRADFYPELMNSGLWGEASSHRMEIAPLRGEALREAIEKPAGDVGVYLEGGLADRLVADAAEEPGALPLLQETMRLLWAEMIRRFLPLRIYEQLGAGSRSGLAVAIANRADATLNELASDEQKPIARRIFLRLVQFGEGRPDTRRQQLVSSLRSEDDNPPLFEQTLRHLEKNRLLTVTGEEKGPEKKVDLAHEALITGWPQLQEWAKERRGAEQTRRRLENKAQEWIRLERKGGLLDEVEIKEVEQWLQGPDAAELGGESLALRDLLQASSAAVWEQKKREDDARQRELEQARTLARSESLRAKSAKRLASALALLLGLTIATGAVSWYLIHVSKRLRMLGVARSLLDEALSSIPNSTSNLTDSKRGEYDERSLLLARQAYNFNRRYGGPLTGQIDSTFNTLLSIVPFRVRVSGLKPPVQSVAFSRDGKFMGIASRGVSRFASTLSIWSLGQPGPPREFSLNEAVSEVTFDPLGRWLAIVGDSPDLLLISLHDQVTSRVKLPVGKNPIRSVAISPDGSAIATGASDGTILIHQLPRLDLPPKVIKAEAAIASLAFRADGKILASMTSSANVAMWNLQQPQVTATVLDTSSRFSHRFFDWGPHESAWGESNSPVLAFSPDGSVLAANIVPNVVRVWSTGQAGYPYRDTELKKTEDDAVSMQITSLAFSPDGKTLALGAWTVFALDLTNVNTTPRKLLNLEVRQVSQVVYAPDGRLAVAYEDGVDIWKLRSDVQKPIALNPPKLQESWASPETVVDDQALTISHDGSHVLSAGWGLSLAVWSLGSNLPPSVLKRDDVVGQFACFLADGNVLIPGSETLLRYDPQKKSVLPINLSGYVSSQAIACSDDAATIVAASDGPDESTVRVWEHAASNNKPWMLSLPAGDEHEARIVTSIALSSRGDRLAVGTVDGNVRFWDLKKHDPKPRLVVKQGQRVTMVAFSHDGLWLASAGSDGIIQLRRTDSPDVPTAYLRGHDGAVTGLCYDGQDHRLASGGTDGTVRVWNTDHPEDSPLVRTSPARPVTGVALHPDGRIVIAGGPDRALTLWDIGTDTLAAAACRNVIGTLTQEEWARFVGADLRYEQTCPAVQEK
jgi:WD40 repeat protein